MSASQTRSGRLVLTGGRVRSMDPTLPRAEVVVLEGDRILDVGPSALAEVHHDAERRDLAGHALVPGFIDAHCHLSIAALHPVWGDCSAVRAPSELAKVLHRMSQEDPEAEWLRVCGWDETTTGLTLDRHDLDEMTGDRPAIVVHMTYHQGVVNSAGLDRLGIGRASAARDDLIVTDETGEPTGLLIERAFGLAHTASMAPFTDPDRWTALVAARARLLQRHGITAVHDAACDPAAEAMYALMAREDLLPVSVLVLPHPAPFLTHGFGARLDGPTTGEGDEWLGVGPLKLFADGGAAPAVDVHFGGEHVAFGYRQPDLLPRLVEAVDRGFRVAVHAMGNAGIGDALEAFRAAERRNPDDDHRFRLEHAGLAGPALATEIAELGAVGVIQPGFVDHVGEQTGDFQPDDATWLPFATLAEAGVRLAGSSDDPCSYVAPLRSARFGLERRTRTGVSFAPEQSLPLDTWLEAYTSGAAHAGGQEAARGTITPGKRADLVVLDVGGDWPEVVETWVAGELVYERATSGAWSSPA
ncbi:MAG: N-substituted formamide deformylase [Acidimicrobiales bacterium]|nr:MAG: hypothetical protein EDR02_05420 [Actinomycetota bacterium]MBV6508651.1 N-substituted formamide deformylase [Acidimicrobiales bacterium]RIK08095.1 MAG: hypothetical protein DCC48_01540 [Acidobacteriota bacterium]